MDGALWGALGALLGAGLTALGGYLGPLRVARVAAEERAEERRRQRGEEEVTRLIALRAAYRDWHDYLYEVVDAKAHGRLRESAAEVEDRIEELRKATQAATDAVMRDGWWVGSYDPHTRGASRRVLQYVDGSLSAADDDGGPYAATEVDRLYSLRAQLNEHIMLRLSELVGGREQRLALYQANYPPS
ncbi:hypothetical protein ABB07_23235 [Streptomyces incarnatus]|uniref:Secreted protein n=1 Tax=Streptomyces incarnatus TaxID=665007 RepID=A0ABM5TPJ4_9ACTN|nr:hypothetical protein [Streptomyces incarnatus]AKJ12840.1 hypothetical protein ABB07_23235 [Streptomyces incarnatus]